MFLNRLNGKPVGFSVLGIFVIDKNTILMVNFLAKFQFCHRFEHNRNFDESTELRTCKPLKSVIRPPDRYVGRP